jgi:hypothetical protein
MRANLLEEQDDASTPLTEEEREQLIPAYITLRHELNEAEQANILEAEEWAFTRNRNVLDERFLINLCLQGSFSGRIQHIGKLPSSILPALISCALQSDDISGLQSQAIEN